MQEPKDPRTSGKVAMYVLLGMAAFTTVLIWIGG